MQQTAPCPEHPGALRACLGLDVAKADFVAAFTAAPGTTVGRMPAKSFARSPQGVAELCTWLQALRADEANALPAVMEATGAYSAELADWLSQAPVRLVPCIVNPLDARHHRKSLGLRNNTDKLAAQALALLGQERNPKPYEPLDPARAELRSLTRYRDHMVVQRTAMSNRLKEPVVDAWVRRREQAEFKRLDAEVARVDKRLRAHVQAHPALAHDIQLLSSMTGIGFLTAAVLLGEGGDLRRFTKAKQLSAYAGLSPAHDESGSSVHKRPRLCKKGNARMRQALYLSATTIIRYDNDLTDFYQRLREAGKEKMVALAAVMRKMLLVLRAMLIADKPYEPHRLSGGKACGKLAPKTEEK